MIAVSIESHWSTPPLPVRVAAGASLKVKEKRQTQTPTQSGLELFIGRIRRTERVAFRTTEVVGSTNAGLGEQKCSMSWSESGQDN